MIDVAVQIEK